MAINGEFINILIFGKSKVGYTTSWRNNPFHKLEKILITNNRLMKIIVEPILQDYV